MDQIQCRSDGKNNKSQVDGHLEGSSPQLIIQPRIHEDLNLETEKDWSDRNIENCKGGNHDANYQDEYHNEQNQETAADVEEEVDSQVAHAVTDIKWNIKVCALRLENIVEDISNGNLRYPNAKDGNSSG